MAHRKQEQAGYDYLILIPTILLLGFGLIAIYSSSSQLFSCGTQTGGRILLFEEAGGFLPPGSLLFDSRKKYPGYPISQDRISSSFYKLCPAGGDLYPRTGQNGWRGMPLA